jgi:hypothetical protein
MVLLIVGLVSWLPATVTGEGCAWEWVNPAPPEYDLASVIHAAGMYVAVGDRGVIVTSSDGVEWDLRWSHGHNGLYGLTYGNGLFVAVGRDGLIVTSPDGITWTERACFGSGKLQDVAWGGGRFVAVGGVSNGDPRQGPDLDRRRDLVAIVSPLFRLQ